LATEPVFTRFVVLSRTLEEQHGFEDKHFTIRLSLRHTLGPVNMCGVASLTWINMCVGLPRPVERRRTGRWSLNDKRVGRSL